VPFDCSARFYVDGKWVDGKLGWKNQMKSTSILGLQVSPTTLRPLTFSSMETTGKSLHRSRVFCTQLMTFFWADDDRYLDSTKLDNIKSLGEIEAHMRQVEVGGIVPTTFRSVAEAEPVHERSKKAMAHRVK